jgi:hypothetical protein
MKINQLQFNKMQEVDDTCTHCGNTITSTNGSCESCDDDPRKDEWTY